jgi:hypothetical protein
MKTKARNIIGQSSIVFLQLAIVLFGLLTLAFLLWEPHLEGRNDTATWSQIYFNDPFLMYAYVGAIAFFVALYSAFRLLGYIARGEVFTGRSLDALKRIKLCAITLSGFALGFEIYLFTVQRQTEEDIAGGVMMGLLLFFGSTLAAALAGVFQKVLQNAVDIKSENNLTV